MNSLRSKTGGQPGFALLAVLVILVILSLLASNVALVSERAVRDAKQRIERETYARDAFSTRETLLYLLATQRVTVAGLTVDEQLRTSTGELRPISTEDLEEGVSSLPVGNEIRLDGTPYRGIGRVVFALQDGRGLISANWSPWFVRKNLAEQLGSPPRAWPDLESMRLDYQDPDELTRPNGAERRDYVGLGLRPPTNRPIVTPIELRGMVGWASLLQPLDDAELMQRMTTTWDVFLNVNTAPIENLTLVPELAPASASRAIDLRQLSPWTTTWSFADTFGLRREDVRDSLFLLPNGTGTLSLWDAGGGPVDLLHWTLTGADEGGYPWRLDYDFVLPRPEESAARSARTPPTELLAAPVPDRR